jgi:hypothetical protein
LRDCNEDTLRLAVGRVERQYGWRLPGDPSGSLLDRIDGFFAMAEARKSAIA